MTRLEKCIILKEKGYKYNPETGKIYGVTGKEIKRISKYGYIEIAFPKLFKGGVKAHHYAWYITYGNVDFIMLDHKNQIRNDNRISNLRILDNQKNTWNSKSKGVSFDKKNNIWRSRIMINYKNINLGYFNTKEEAKQAYLEAKKKYHHI